MTDEEKVIKSLLKYQRDFDEYSLKAMAARLNSKKGLGLADLFDVTYFTMVFGVMRDIEQKGLSVRQRQVRELDKLLTSSAISAYMSMKSLYADSDTSFVPYKANEDVKKYIASETTKKVREFNDAMRKTGYPMTDAQTGKKVFRSPSETYQHVANMARSQELNNPFGFKTWSRKIMRGLLREGLKIYNYNQDTHRYKHQNSYSYIKNFVNNAVYQISQGVFNIVANQIGINGVELSVHMDSALDHLPVQGHQFTLDNFKKMQSNEDFEDIQGRRYHYLDRAIGTWNCRHFVYPIIIGKTVPKYTDEQLDEIKKKSEVYKVVDMPNGEKWFMSYSEYVRYQQNLQNKIDVATMDLHVAEKLGDKWLIDHYKAKLSECKAELGAFKSKV